MPQFSNVDPELAKAHQAFGKSYGIWLKTNGISQQTPHIWTQERKRNGIEPLCPIHNSQVSTLVRAKLLPSGAGVFLGLEAFNRAIADNDTKGVDTRRIVDVIKEAEPYLTGDGKVADMVDFFAMWTGRMSINTIYQPALYYTDKDATECSIKQQEGFREFAQERMMSPLEAWDALEPHLQLSDESYATKLKKVLAGWDQWTAAELNEMPVVEGQNEVCHQLTAFVKQS